MTNEYTPPELTIVTTDYVPILLDTGGVGIGISENEVDPNESAL